MKAIDIRNKYLDFFKSKEHSIIAGAPLVPENDPTVLFTTAGMHPLVPYLSGQTHPEGKRLADYQKCLRTDDIDEVGDNRHLTFFEMLGNWSLGDYFKEESIKMSFEFLTKWLEIPVEKLSVSCFAGDNDAPKDMEAFNIWKSVGIPENKIYFYGKKENWWGPAGQSGPCGPDTEIFYDTGKEACSSNCGPDCDCGKHVEIWNNVFMQYNKKLDGTFEPLAQKNVDTGLGLERVVFLLQGKKDVFETELFSDIIAKASELAKVQIPESFRIIADHLRASAMLIVDSVRPSNVDQGYVLRRLIRRTIRHMRKTEIDPNKIREILEVLVSSQIEMYPELEANKEAIYYEIEKEKNRFMNTLLNGEKEFDKVVRNLKSQNISKMDGQNLFRLYDTFGFPPEVTAELAKEQDMTVDINEFKVLFEKHQELSRQGAEQKFKGGLADNGEETVKYHTATHLLHQALKQVLGAHVMQKGANITAERLRFDFANPEKLTPEQITEVEKIINEQIAKKIPVICEEMSVQEAKDKGAIGIFDSKYGDLVKVYTIGDFSKEICGGPHVENTSKLDKIKIAKEEAVSSGVRRIKAIFVKE
ncbi:MAG: alanine--tRNA ligase [Clostridia bacterium]|nr:alanine--tRNA ligase [Clostridia bacterium]